MADAADLKQKDWATEARKALGPVEVVSKLAQLSGWALTGDGPDVAIEKTYSFRDYYQTLAFVNALALIAHRHDHHPDLVVRYGSVTVRFNTHDVKGLSASDFLCAAAADALLAA
ncbi:pterin-4-alpha-carbinolamine dehydratase [Xylophilus rhododendri]|uniref:Putative pterin-4-alpha-carbinolamine dehydratase n=1 Tax=Xylophilus rhododendri TaxID=2697032 RepID=A0A857J8U4_9BURK|nr:4a-hydroxytetrahydrobiopterin dehydratase [Xylophilus rhododendri]QHJ00297.1 pterin-4-alpha-carbinolamine dehydratase [Xylophilus rhododendri]